MPRVTRVNKAQQRYATRPVIDPETGEPKRTPVMRTRKVWNELKEEYEVVTEQKKTKSGRPVFMTVTEVDKSKPKPNLRCDFPGCDIDGGEITPGSAYMWIAPKSGPYGGRQLNRHQSHPVWNVWEYSSSWSARIAQATSGFSIDGAETPEDVQSALDDVAEAIRELAEESREAASNIEEGFGHPTSQSEEAEQRADDLEGWADEIEQADIPDLPEPEERYFIEGPDGTRHGDEVGYATEEDARDALTGMIEDLLSDAEDETTEDDYEIVGDTLDEPSEEQMDEWRSEVEDACSIVDESPV